MEPRFLRVDDLPVATVDPKSPVPLYHQIELDLRDMILAGSLMPHDVLPPEMELCRKYGVGRHTMRQALARLAADGLIERQIGRGTFVRTPADRTRFYLDRSFTHQMADMGLEAHSKVLATRTGIITESLPKPLHGKLDKTFFQLERLRYGGDEPLGIQKSIIITERCPDIKNHNYNKASLYETLYSVYQLSIRRIMHTISAVIATPSQAQLLQIHEGAPLLSVNTSAYLEDSDIIEFTISFYRADRYEYSTTHTYT